MALRHARQSVTAAAVVIPAAVVVMPVAADTAVVVATAASVNLSSASSGHRPAGDKSMPTTVPDEHSRGLPREGADGAIGALVFA
jgi:hypothetical protein